MKIINKNPGLSINKITRRIGWTKGRVDGSIRRLLKSKRIYIKVFDDCGRTSHFVYPYTLGLTNQIEVPDNLLRIGNPFWQEAHVYGLDNITIGATGRANDEWEKEAWKKIIVPTEKGNGKVTFSLPDEFVRFYQLNKRDKTVAIGDNNILITVSGEILTEKNYPA